MDVDEALNIDRQLHDALSIGRQPGIGTNIDRELCMVLSELARTLVTDFPLPGILDHLVAEVAEILPIDSAGVTVLSAGSAPRHLAASDPSAMHYVQLQSTLCEGPCIAPDEGPIIIPDLRVDGRFPNFASAAVRAGLAAVFTFPLLYGERRLGALDLYRSTTGGLDPEYMLAAATLADVAASYIIIAATRDQMRLLSERAHHQSLHDELTGLPNRTFLVAALDQAILRSSRSSHNAGIYYVDLDRFKAINDLYGHDAGDELLVAIASRLKAMVRASDTVARIGGDEFVILCDDIDDRRLAELLADRIERALTEPFKLSLGTVTITASVGVAVAGQDGGVAKEILHTADSAMYEAKRRRNRLDPHWMTAARGAR